MEFLSAVGCLTAMTTGARQWAVQEFGLARLGDVRRTRRLVEVASGVMKAPAGKVSDVFADTRGREGAYDLLENEHVTTEAVASAMFSATAARAKAGGSYVYVAVDGSSLKLTEVAQTKGFGRVGSDERGARGLKVMNAYCINAGGVPLGLVDQKFWARPVSPTAGATKKEKTKRLKKTPFEDKESAKFLDAAKASVERLEAVGVRSWIVIDREGDNRNILMGLSLLPCHMTVRASWDRLVADTHNDKEMLRAYVGKRPILGTYDVKVGRTGQRKARSASMTVRTATVELRLRDKQKGTETRLPMQVVWVRETEASASAAGVEPLDWVLYTNVQVQTHAQALAVVQSYAFRWRIEEFHRTWKTGACNVEDTQLRSFNAVTVWATILAAIAARVEQLKYLSRNQPEAPATLVLSPVEIDALVGLRKQGGLPVSDAPPTIAEATRWVAELGGFISHNGRNGPPGSITLARGLERLVQITRGFELALSLRKK